MSGPVKLTAEQIAADFCSANPGKTAVVIKDGQGIIRDSAGVVAFHVTPAIDENCVHDWGEGADGNPEQCVKCGLSFIRYVHSLEF